MQCVSCAMIRWLLPVCIAVVILCGCDGLDPTVMPPPFTGLSGTITYKGGPAAWPADSVYEVRVVVFDSIPKTPQKILPDIIAGKAIFTGQLPVRVESSTYELAIYGTPRTFTYVVVAMRYGPDIAADWKMLTVVDIDGDPTRPASVHVEQNQRVNIDFTVDFANLPPQPFE